MIFSFPANLNLLMLSKRGYLIHFTRLFFASLLIGICSFLSYLWNVYQPIYLAFQLHRCQTNKISQINIWNWFNDFHLIDLLPSFFYLSKCHLYIKNDYPLNVNQLFDILHSILIIYFIYHLIRLSIFHVHLKQFEIKRNYYGHLYREDQKSRCFNRLL
jgi:hypothetical protein